jgi:hypothetical protein
VLVLLSTSFILLQNKGIQTYAAKKVMKVISENLDIKLEIDAIDIAFFNKVKLNNVYIEDLHRDTLLYADQVIASLIRFPSKKRVPVNTLSFKNARINLISDSLETINIKFFIDQIRSKDSTKAKRVFTFRNIRLNNSRLSISRYYTKEKKYGMNFSDLVFNNLNAEIRRMNKTGDSLRFTLKSMSFKEKSGFILNDFHSKARISNKYLIFENAIIETPFSKIQGRNIGVTFNSFQDFQPDVIYESIRLGLYIDPSTINVCDMAYFAPGLCEAFQLISFTGEITGKINNLKGRNINIEYGDNSIISGEFDLDGLPDFKETFIYANLKKFNTTIEDIESFELPGRRKIILSDRFKVLKYINYKGKFTGFIDDFVTYGDITTDLGKIKSDILFNPDTSHFFTFSGNVETEEFNVGRLLNNDKDIGKVSLNLNVNGSSASGQTLNAELDGLIHSLELKQYGYKNIKLSGLLSNKTYNGSITIHDPNIILEFLGKVDLTNEVHEFNFSANINDANLYHLNFDKTDPTHKLSFYIEANAQGNSLKNLNGEIKLLNSLFTKKNKQIQIYDFNIKAYNNGESNSFIIRSDFIDADLIGSYQLDKINVSLAKFLHSYLPAFVSSKYSVIEDFKNGFHFNIRFKKTKPIFDYFMPQHFIASNSTCEGEFDPDINHLSLFFQSPKLKIYNNTWNNVYFNSQSNDSIFSLVSGSQNLILGDKITLENFTIYSDTKKDSINLMARWNNWDTLLYKGVFKATATFSKPVHRKYPLIAINLIPTEIITTDTLWQLNKCKIIIDSNSVFVDNLKINHDNQYFRLNGKLSENPDDIFSIEFNEFNIGNLNIFTKSEGIELKGTLNGDARISNFYNNPLIYSSLAIDTLVINEEILGNTVINSNWNNDIKTINIDAFAKRGRLKTIGVSGDYWPKNKGKLDLSVELNKLRLNLINPYLKNVFSDFIGIASGNLDITGNILEPVINGRLKFQKTAFTINYLKSRYNFTNEIKIVNNKALLDDIKIMDEYGNSATMKGFIKTKYLRDIDFDFKINANNLLFLNTGLVDNSQFYGKAFASGYATIKGKPGDITMNVSVMTEKDTKLYIPLSNTGEISEYNFIAFLSEDTMNNTDIKNGIYKIDLSVVNLDMDLEVTPDAEVQLIFDPKVGDIMKSKGHGNINLQISTLGKFKIFGEYYIEEGDYLFTLQNVINRKFEIDNGYIRWSGDPLDADINIKAIYPTKASLFDLFGYDTDRQIQSGSQSIPNASDFSGDIKYRRNTTVYCQLLIQEKLMKPNISYDIYLPLIDEQTRERVRNEINTEEELNKQFLSLLVLNRFMLSSKRQGSSMDYSSYSPYSNAAGVNASEFLSNQLSHWLSQISSDYDVRINYRPSFDDQITSDEVEVALSTQLLNDKLTVNGNVDVNTNATAQSSNNIVGDFDLDYKITEKFHLKAYNHSNDDLLTEVSPYTQGLGVVYKVEFNNFEDLWKKSWASLFGNKNKKASKK